MMKEGRQEDQWQHTAQISYLIASVFSTNSKELKREDFNLYYLTNKILDEPKTATQEQLKQIAEYFRNS